MTNSNRNKTNVVNYKKKTTPRRKRNRISERELYYKNMRVAMICLAIIAVVWLISEFVIWEYNYLAFALCCVCAGCVLYYMPRE